MIRAGTAADLPLLRRLAAGGNDAPYDLERVIEEKAFGAGMAGRPHVRIFEQDGQAAGFAVSCGNYLRLLVVDRSHRRRGVGTALLGSEGVIGAEPGNYFIPGVPAGDRGTIDFLRGRGYREGKTTWNLEADLTAAPAPSASADSPARVKHDERERFLSFVEGAFGATWRFEAARAFENDPPTAFWIEGAGFAVHEANNRRLGTFGPAGVAPPHRGRGIGRKLLLSSLADLRRLGFERAIIPWTDALDFYRKSSAAEAAHRFIAFRKPL